MKRRIFSFLLLSILLVTASCSEQSPGQELPSGQPTPSSTGGNTITEAAETPSLTPTPALPAFEPKEDEICLTLMCSCAYIPLDEKVNALNWYLREHGYGFYVEVIAASSFLVDGADALDLSYTRVLEAKDAGTKVDLLLLYSSPEEAFDAVERGVLLRLSPFLEQEGPDSWVGKVPQSYWESVQLGNGEKRDVYGLYSSPYGIVDECAIVVNEELFSSAGIALPTELSLEDLPDLLEELSESGALEKNGISAPLLTEGLSWENIWCLTGGATTLYEVMLERHGETFECVNIFNKEKFVDAAVALYDLYQSGKLKVTPDAEEKVLAKQFAVAFSFGGPMMRAVKKDVYQQDGVRLYKRPYFASARSEVCGIASWSEHPQEAYQLLTLLYSNEDVANLLYYGATAANVEAGEHVKDGVSLCGLTNQLMLDHVLTDSEKEAYVEILREAPVIPILYNEPILSGELEAAEWKNGEVWDVYGQEVEVVFGECKTEEELRAYLKRNHDVLAENQWYPRIIESWNRQLAQD